MHVAYACDATGQEQREVSFHVRRRVDMGVPQAGEEVAAGRLDDLGLIGHADLVRQPLLTGSARYM